MCLPNLFLYSRIAFFALLLTRFRLASNTFSPCCKRLLALLRTCVYVCCNTFLALSEYIFGFPQTLFCFFFKHSFRILLPLCCEPPNTLKFLNEHSLLLCVHCFCSWFALVFLSEKHPFVFCEHRFRATRAS